VIRRDSTLAEVAFAVCTALDRAGVTAVLTGGSAATVYAPAANQSSDVDFIITFGGDGSGDDALTALGYLAKNGAYVHAESPFPIEFPPGPLMVGGDNIVNWSTLRDEFGQLLHILTPTDSCRDRLAALG
jgi:hypothetical protein